jgi:hypothetical protein
VSSQDGGFVSVDPQRVDLLAKALRDLSDVLQANGKNIADTMTSWGSALSLARLNTEMHQVPDDAAAMRTRADLAAELYHRQQSASMWTQLNAPGQLGSGGLLSQNSAIFPPVGPPRVSLTWSDNPDATVDAWDTETELRQLAANPGGDGYQDAVNQLAQRLHENQGNPVFMAAFYQSGGTADITAVFSGYGQNVPPSAAPMLGLLADNLAAATNLTKQAPGGGPAPLSVKDFAALVPTDQKSLFATGFVMQYGPDGSVWDPSVLAAIGDPALKMTQKTWDDSLKHQQAGTSGDYPAIPLQIYQTQANAIFTRVGQNVEASRVMLADPTNGPLDAAALVDLQWSPQIVYNATSDRTGTNAPLSARAALNIFHAVAGLSDPSVMTPDFASALSNAAGPYVFDLAKSTHGDIRTDTVGYDPETGNLSFLQLTPKTLSCLMMAIGFYQVANNDHPASDHLNSLIAAQTTLLVKDNGANVDNDIRYLGSLEGFVAIGQEHGNIKAAQAKDAANMSASAWFAFAMSALSSVPIPGPEKAPGLVEVPFQVATGALSAPVLPYWPQTNASDAAAQAQINMHISQSRLDLPIAQGLLNRDPKLRQQLLADPVHYSWYRNGLINPRNDAEQSNFNTWFESLPTSLSGAADQGFNDSTTTFNVH